MEGREPVGVVWDPQAERLVVVCDDGAVLWYDTEEWEWRTMTPIPNTEAAQDAE